ncbi:hypothetical protein ACLB2K_039738 [Fragaria x ananassa]
MHSLDLRTRRRNPKMNALFLYLKKRPKLKQWVFITIVFLAASSFLWVATSLLQNSHYTSNLGLSAQSSLSDSTPYHNFKLFSADFKDMIQSFKIYVYPTNSSDFAQIFDPHPNPFDPKLGNYFSEHMFKLSLLQSSLITSNPEEAHLYFLPFSVNLLRNDPRVHSEEAISDFVAHYTDGISQEFPFWNASMGLDHFYACCHSVCREAMSKHNVLRNNAIQLTCSSSYFQRFYIAHKDVSMPQVWPRPPQLTLNPPKSRDKLVFFAGRVQNSNVRQQLVDLWGNDTRMDIYSENPGYPYEEGFKRSKYCLHVKGYEVNTARVSDAIHYGCVPVIMSNYYELPFANVLNWTTFSVIINHNEPASLKKTLLSITKKSYLKMYRNLLAVRRHFIWHKTPKGYDSFHMTAYQLWLKRWSQRPSF